MKCCIVEFKLYYLVLFFAVHKKYLHKRWILLLIDFMVKQFLIGGNLRWSLVVDIMYYSVLNLQRGKVPQYISVLGEI